MAPQRQEPAPRGVKASPHLPAMAQKLVGQHASHHRLAHRHSPDADAWIVAALGDNLGLGAFVVDGAARREDRRGWLHREARDDRLARRYAPQHAAGVVRQKRRRAVLAPAHFVGVVLAGEFGGGESRSDLDALDRVDRHQRAGEFRVELAIDRRAPADGNAHGLEFDHRADNKTAFLTSSR